ncbi:hypothetical protein QJS04_geneDACA011578 [Acorus gramineus]|uniref:Uncharacterized protein n=1 Tax=Acorus gramineus TaxID=55184 RepID=A0AAV9AEP4_ACOGR|nr:hypothetical protein QJS04_geneDACA011578 [Acorus gramineus]
MGKKSGSAPTQPISIITTAVDSTLPETEAEELPLSSNIADNPLDESEADLGSLPVHDLSSMSETYDKFKCDQEAKLEEWLKEAEDCNKIDASDMKLSPRWFSHLCIMKDNPDLGPSFGPSLILGRFWGPGPTYGPA